MIKENRVSKYIIYAIGEIVLVVIGILIALQVNNWNQVRHQKEVEAIYLTQLLEETKADSIFYHSRLALVKSQFQTYANLIELCDGTANYSTISHIPTDNEIPFTLVALGSATLKSIAQDGEKISAPSVKQSLRYYEERYEFVKAIIDLLNKDITEIGNDLRITFAYHMKKAGSPVPLSDYKFLCEEENFIGIISVISGDLRNAEEIIESFLTANRALNGEIIEYLESNQ